MCKWNLLVQENDVVKRYIFLSLLWNQAYEIATMSSQYIKGTEATKYWENASIGCIPQGIAEKGIVVASSNHGAVQNIVDELPLLDKIDKEFQDEIVSIVNLKR